MPSGLVRRCLSFAAAVLFGASSLAAQGTTGKIEGTVRDQAGAPVAGAQVLIVGSAFATSSNEQGYYFFNNVPAGVLTLRAQFIGYAPTEIRNVRVFAGQTFTHNLTLEQRAVEVGGINVIADANPIVPRDQVTSKPIVAGELVQNLPADNVTDVLRLQPGVVESNRGLSIRGGRVGEAAIYVDGVPVRSISGNVNTIGAQGTDIGIGTNAVEEASITTGAIGATQGDAQSGVISFVTRSGGPRFSGFLSYETDELGSNATTQGLNRIEGSFGGPLARNLTFFVATTLAGQQNGLRGKGAGDQPLYVLSGIDTTITVAAQPGDANSDSATVALPAFTRYDQGQRRPDQWSNNWTVDAKVRYSYGTGSNLALTYHRVRGQGLNFRGGNIYNPMAQTGFRNVSNALILNWTQNLARSSERALSLDAAFSLQNDEGVAGLVDQTWFNNNRDPFGSFTFSDVQFLTDLDNFPIDERLIQNLRVNNCSLGRDGARPDLGGCVPMLNRNDLGASAPFISNPYGVTAGNFPTSGVGNAAIGLNTETRITGRANLDWQADRYNRFQFGGDFVRADVKTYLGGLISQAFMDANIYQPSRWSLYATDRLDLGDVVVDLGLRYDRLNPDVLYSRTPGRVFTDPLRHGDLTAARTAADTAVAQNCAAALAAADTTSWSTCNMVPASNRGVLLPSVRVSFPVTDRTGFRLSYAQQAQSPNFNLLATGVNTDLALSNTNDIFGRDLDYGKTIIFEFGVRHAFSGNMVLDIAAYNKDKVSDVTARIMPIFDPFRNEITNLNVMTNLDFGNVRGIDLRLDRRIGDLFQGSVTYTYQSARSTGSDPVEYLGTLSRVNSNVTGDRAPPPQALIKTRDDRTHNIAGSLALNFPNEWGTGSLGAVLRNFGAFATFRFASGLAYTRMVNDGGGATGPGNAFGLASIPAEPLNASQMPWIKNVDLRLTKGFRFGGNRDLTLYADFRNLFNFTNLAQIFAETGDVVNEQFYQNTIDPIRTSLAGDAGTLVVTRNRPTANGTVAETGVDLSDCSAYLPGNSRGVPDCIMLRRAEARFGDGDNFFSEAEQDTAFRAFYNLNNAPHTLYGPGFNFRLGVQLSF